MLRLPSPEKTKANARPVAILTDPRAWVLSGAHQLLHPEKCQTEWNKVFMPPPSFWFAV